VGISIREEYESDHKAVWSLHTLAFGDDGCVARLVEALRIAKAPLPPLSFVATVDGEVTGHVMLSASRLDAPQRLVDVYVLSPLGVLPAYQRNRTGTKLVRHAIGAADVRGVPLVFLEGSPSYYGTRGFDRADTAGFRSPSLRIPPPAFQVARLSRYEEWMTGTLVYSETFWAQDCVGLREPASASFRERSADDPGGR
jgi:putative acetyltransferase